MIDSTARVARFEGDFAPSPAYLWAPPQKPVTVSIPLAIVDRLERESVESFRSLTSRGSEIGGLLFGSVKPGSPLAVTIQTYEPVACEYARGPLYRLSDVELARLDRAIEQRAAAGMLAVGFYRSQTRKGLSLDSDDIALFESRFKEAHHIALLIRPNAAKAASVAGIFIREDGKINGDATCLEFPFRSSQHEVVRRDEGLYDGAVAGPRSVNTDPAPARPVIRGQIVPIASRRDIAPEAQLAAPPAVPLQSPEPAPEPEMKEEAAPDAVAAAPVVAEPVAAAPVPEPAPAPISVPAPSVAESEPEPVLQRAPAVSALFDVAPVAEKKSGKLVWIVSGAAASVVLVAGLLFTTGVLVPGRKTPAVAGQDTSSLALRVDRNGADIVLTWNRDSEAIRTASRAVLSIADGPQHENVEMDLAQLKNGSIVYAPVTSDVVFKMEVSGADQTKTASESVRVLRTRPSPLTDPNVQTPVAAPPQAPKTDAAAATADPAAPAPEEKVKLAQAVKPFTPQDSLAGRLRAGASSEMPDAPMLGAPAPSAANVSLGNLVGSHAAPPPPSPATAPTGAAPVERTLTVGGHVQQAQLIRRRDPEYPKLARDAGASGLVELVATIAADGHVREVRVVKGHPLLRKPAVDAVKTWVYKPTILNGVAVETDTQVLLNFKNDK
jgi:protein TonB